MVCDLLLLIEIENSSDRRMYKVIETISQVILANRVIERMPIPRRSLSLEGEGRDLNMLDESGTSSPGL